MKTIALALAASLIASPALADTKPDARIKTTQVVSMSVDDIHQCLQRNWGAPFLVTKEGESTRIGYNIMGNTFSALILTPVKGETKVEGQGNGTGEKRLKKCVSPS